MRSPVKHIVDGDGPPSDALSEEEWICRLTASRVQLENARTKANEAYETHCANIRAAFADGLPLVPIREATGLTASRLHQVKAGRRT